MTIKSILCIVGGIEEAEINAIHTALILGKLWGAHIRFLYISPNPASYAAMYGCGDVYTCEAVIDTIEKENARNLNEEKQKIITITNIHNIPLDKNETLIHGPSAKFIHRIGYHESIIAQEGRLCDLIVMGRDTNNPDTLYNSKIVASLFNTGRPVLLLPDLRSSICEQAYKTIAIAWKDTVQAARAMHDALPLLEKAEKVIVLSVQGQGETYDKEAETTFSEYLRSHNIPVQSIIVATGNHTPAEALLIRAKELEVELLVMGAYGHSRFREMLLGGVTNYMLEKADIPLLLAH